MPINKNAAFRYRIIDACLSNNMRKYPTLEKKDDYMAFYYLFVLITITINLWSIRNTPFGFLWRRYKIFWVM
jgi:hypothetical protein